MRTICEFIIIAGALIAVAMIVLDRRGCYGGTLRSTASFPLSWMNFLGFGWSSWRARRALPREARSLAWQQASLAATRNTRWKPIDWPPGGEQPDQSRSAIRTGLPEVSPPGEAAGPQPQEVVLQVEAQVIPEDEEGPPHAEEEQETIGLWQGDVPIAVDRNALAALAGEPSLTIESVGVVAAQPVTTPLNPSSTKEANSR